MFDCTILNLRLLWFTKSKRRCYKYEQNDITKDFKQFDFRNLYTEVPWIVIRFKADDNTH